LAKVRVFGDAGRKKENSRMDRNLFRYKHDRFQWLPVRTIKQLPGRGAFANNRRLVLFVLRLVTLRDTYYLLVATAAHVVLPVAFFCSSLVCALLP